MQNLHEKFGAIFEKDHYLWRLSNFQDIFIAKPPKLKLQ